MKYLSIRLVNYKPIYNGLGVYDIYIDLSKAIHNMIVIIADNGAGKSTIMDALEPLPDSNNKFIDGMEAMKEIYLQDNDIVYHIKFIHGYSNNKRETTKAYIRRIYQDGSSDELNENGNITSFKEVLYDELELDPNFLFLSHLSSVKRGIGVMTTSERKMLVNSLIKEVSVYNDLYKTFSKRSTAFKTIINNIVSKMNMIGDEEKVRLSLVSIENRINSLMETKDKYIEDLASHKSRAKLLDPNGDIQNTYNTIYTSLISVNDKYDKVSNDIKKSIVANFNLDENTTEEELLKYNKNITEEYSNLEVDIRVQETNVLNKLNDREKEAKDIQDKIAKLDSIKLSMEFDDIDLIIQREQSNLSILEQQVSSMGLLNSDITKEEYIIGIETLNNIKDTISVFKSDCELHIIEQVGEYIISGKSLPNIFSYDEEISKLNEIINENNLIYSKYMMMKDTLYVLKDRPENCKIDTCPFIENAVVSKHNMESIDIDKVTEIIESCRERISMLTKEKEDALEIIKYTNLFNNVIRDIKIHASVLKKLPIDSTMYTNTNKLVSLILNGYDFKEIIVLYNNINKAESIELYKQSKDRLAKLQNERKLYESKINTIDELTKAIADTNSKLDEINSELDGINKVIADNKNRLAKLNTLKMCFNNIFVMFSEKRNLESEKNKLLSSFNNIKTDMINIKESLDNIKLCNDNLANINGQITPLLEDRDKLKFGLTQLEQYKVDLQEFNAKYEKVETFKRYSSPSKDGIQNIFIELYMHQTLKLTNDILSLMFDGEFVVGDFVLNEKEFRIPVFGNGFPHDDVSSMSNAQVSMIQMIISFVLLNQSSPKYNIAKLDEPDSMLDTKNRLQFVNAFEMIRKILGIEQAIVISHNNEINLQEASIILLKYSQDIDRSYDIIFDVNNI